MAITIRKTEQVDASIEVTADSTLTAEQLQEMEATIARNIRKLILDQVSGTAEAPYVQRVSVVYSLEDN